MDISSRQKVHKGALPLNDILHQINIIHIHTYNITSESSRIHILFRCKYNILQERSHTGTQKNFTKNSLVNFYFLKSYEISLPTAKL